MSSTEELTPPQQQKRTFDAMEGDGSPPSTVDRGTRESSQHDKPSISRAGSRIQKIPTKDSAKQYYSQQTIGGWRVLNAEEAAKQMRREEMMHMRNAESIRDELGGATHNERVEETSVMLEEGRSQKPTTPIVIIANHHQNSSTPFQEAKNGLSPPDRVHTERQT